MEELTVRQGQVLGIIRDQIESKGQFPTVRVIAERLRVNPSGVAGHLKALIRKGYVVKQRSFALAGSPKKRSLPVASLASGKLSMPKAASSRANFRFEPAYFSTDHHLIAVHVSGDDLLPFSIADGDLALVAKLGDLDRCGVVLKRTKRGLLLTALKAENSKKNKRIGAYSKQQPEEVIGKVVGVVRKM